MSNQKRFALIGRGFGSDAFNQSAADYIGSILVDGTEINFTYDSATPGITAALLTTLPEDHTFSGDVTFTGEFNIGDPGSESGTITVNGVAFNAVAKINEFGGTQDAELVLHRHATSAPSNLVFSRSRGTTATHADVQDGDILGRMIFVGRHTSSYYWGASIWSEIDGTPGVSDMPCAIVFGTTADGATTPTERFRISPAGALGINGETYGTASQSLVMSGGSAAAPSWLTAGTNDRLLRQTGGALNFGQLTAGMFPNTVVPDAALSSNVPLLNADNTFSGVNSLSRQLTVTGDPCRVLLQRTGGTANQGNWITALDNARMFISTASDAAPTTLVENAITITRSGTNITELAILADQVYIDSTQLNGRPGASTNFEIINRNGTGFHIYVNSAGTLASELSSAGAWRWNTYGAGTLVTDSSGNITAATALSITSTVVIASVPVRLKGYTVAGLPAGTQGDTAYVTDALAPAFLTALVGGGAIVTPAFYNGTNWVAI